MTDQTPAENPKNHHVFMVLAEPTRLVIQSAQIHGMSSKSGFATYVTFWLLTGREAAKGQGGPATYYSLKGRTSNLLQSERVDQQPTTVWRADQQPTTVW